MPIHAPSGPSGATVGPAADMRPIAVLDSVEEARIARAWLRQSGFDIQARPLTWSLARLRYAIHARRRLILTPLKSWDVARFARLLTLRHDCDAAILDVGGVASELPWALALAGFRNVASCDVDPRVVYMPLADRVRYRIGAIESLGFPESSLDAITAVSTVEHGVDHSAFLRTAARLLRPGGHLCISTDYWPDKITTEDVKPFGLPWMIFSRREVEEFVRLAGDVGLTVAGDDATIPEPREAPVTWCGRRYTFLAIVLEKRASDE